MLLKTFHKEEGTNLFSKKSLKVELDPMDANYKRRDSNP